MKAGLKSLHGGKSDEGELWRSQARAVCLRTFGAEKPPYVLAQPRLGFILIFLLNVLLFNSD